ncbi:MAG: SDR family NAD(P)-dependent oxidoreductase [Bacteroidota bacterium]|nr:SDR family NAD(P)-dependent oxidoreductase [Bacteroidota bacterium]
MSAEKFLNGKVAIVTGASKGIGRVIAVSLAEAGASVALAARTEQELNELAKIIQQRGGSALAVRTDVSRSDDISSLVHATLEHFHRIDILINNAGYGVFANVVDAREEDLDGMWNINLRGAFLCSKAVLPTMMKQRSGEIINIDSLAGKNTFAGGAGYSATKWGLLAFSRTLMVEVREYNIRVVTICPGSVNTAFSDHSNDAMKIIQPEDVADTVLFALSMPARSNVSEIDIRPTVKPR